MNGEAIEAKQPAGDGSEQTDASGAVNGKNMIGQRVEKLRARHTALVDRLVAANDPRGDQALRNEIKEIAASMISLTAAREGQASPIHAILASKDGDLDAAETSNPDSLGARASAMLRES